MILVGLTNWLRHWLIKINRWPFDDDWQLTTCKDLPVEPRRGRPLIYTVSWKADVDDPSFEEAHTDCLWSGKNISVDGGKATRIGGDWGSGIWSRSAIEATRAKSSLEDTCWRSRMGIVVPIRVIWSPTGMPEHYLTDENYTMPRTITENVMKVSLSKNKSDTSLRSEPQTLT